MFWWFSPPNLKSHHGSYACSRKNLTLCTVMVTFYRVHLFERMWSRVVTESAQLQCNVIYSFIHAYPILHTEWLDNQELTFKSNSAKYYFLEKSRFLHTFLKFCCESRKI